MKKLVLAAALLFVSVTFTYAQFTFTSIDYPGGNLTTARSINNHGDIVGAYRTTPPRHALLIKGGKFIPLAPATILGTNFSEAFKINDRGDIVGAVADDNGFTHGFLLRKGLLTILDFPGATDTNAYGINESGTIVGAWDLYDAQGNFLYQGGFTWKDGSFVDVAFPGAGGTTVFGINARGDFVGEWDSGPSTTVTGFVFNRGEFTSFAVPFQDASLTQADDISANGRIVGLYADDVTTHGFMKVGDTFTSIDYPDAAITTVWGNNSAGQMVGNWYNSSGTSHGWLAQPGNKEKPSALQAP